MHEEPEDDDQGQQEGWETDEGIDVGDENHQGQEGNMQGEGNMDLGIGFIPERIPEEGEEDMQAAMVVADAGLREATFGLLGMGQIRANEESSFWQNLGSLGVLTPEANSPRGILDGAQMSGGYGFDYDEWAENEWSEVRGPMKYGEESGQQETRGRYENYDLGQFLKGQFVGPIQQTSEEAELMWKEGDLNIGPELWKEHCLASELLGLDHAEPYYREQTYYEDNLGENNQERVGESTESSETERVQADQQANSSETDEETRLWEAAMPDEEKEKRKQIRQGKRKMRRQPKKKAKKGKRDWGEIETRRNMGILIREPGRVEEVSLGQDQRGRERRRIDERSEEQSENGQKRKREEIQEELEMERVQKKGGGGFQGSNGKAKQASLIDIGLSFNLMELAKLVWSEVGTIVNLRAIVEKGEVEINDKAGQNIHGGDGGGQNMEQQKEASDQGSGEEGLPVVDPNQPPRQT